MEAILKFNLPEEKSEFECASKAMDLACFQWDVFQEIRELLKYEKLDSKTVKIIEELQQKLIDDKVHLEYWQ